MNDISNLLGKLKSAVAYRQFADYGAEIDLTAPNAKTALSQFDPRPSALEAAPSNVVEFLESRIETGADAATADAAVAPPAVGSMLRRYRTADPAVLASRNLADIFAHLQRKGR